MTAVSSTKMRGHVKQSDQTINMHHVLVNVASIHHYHDTVTTYYVMLSNLHEHWPGMLPIEGVIFDNRAHMVDPIITMYIPGVLTTASMRPRPTVDAYPPCHHTHLSWHRLPGDQMAPNVVLQTGHQLRVPGSILLLCVSP
jgi:hypothetical protein